MRLFTSLDVGLMRKTAYSVAKLVLMGKIHKRLGFDQSYKKKTKKKPWLEYEQKLHNQVKLHYHPGS